jgi:tetratricopeptide (TPR) repeat protein
MESKRKEAFILNLNKKAQILYEEENIIDSLLLFQRAELILKDTRVVKLQLLTYNNMASYYLKQNNFDLSMDYLVYCTRLQPVDLSSFLFQIGSFLNLSALKSKINKHKESLSFALKALHLLEDYPNECLMICCYYSICMEFIQLGQLRSAEEFYGLGFKSSIKFFGSEHFISQNFFDMKKMFSGYGTTFNEICILGDNLPHVRRPSLAQVERRKVSLDHRRDDDIQINTTPWLEVDNWKVCYVDSRLAFKRKRFSPFPETSKSLALNEGLLDKIDKIIRKSKKVLIKTQSKYKNNQKILDGAATTIQRAFRKYLQFKGKRKVHKINISSIKKDDLDRIEGNKYRTKSELKGKNLKAKYRELFDARLKVFRKSDLNLF